MRTNMQKGNARKKSTKQAAGVKLEKVKGLGFQVTTPRAGAAPRWRVTDKYHKNSKTFKTYAEAVSWYRQQAALIKQEGLNFSLTPTERAALATWRAHREERLRAGLAAMTLERAIQIAMALETEQDTASPLLVDMVGKYVRFLENQGRDPQHVRTVKRRLELSTGFFAEGTRLAAVGDHEARACLMYTRDTASEKHGKEISAQTFHQYAGTLSSLWNWCLERHKVASNPFPTAEKDIAKRERLQRGKAYTTPKSLENMLSWTLEHEPHMVPCLALTAFCGLRPSETHKLRWQDVTIDKAHGSKVHISEAMSKTDSSRMVDICPAAVEWLEAAWKRTGTPDTSAHVVPFHNGDDSDTAKAARQNAWLRLVDKIKENCPPEVKPLGIKEAWPRDLLRHSFGTYYRAKCGSLPETAEQMGNTLQVCRQHYSSAVLKTEGIAYFSVCPK